jgi:hypothetical protein
MSKIDDYETAKKEHEELVEFFDKAWRENLEILNNNSICMKARNNTGIIWMPSRGNDIVQGLIRNDTWAKKVLSASVEQLEALRKEAESEAINFIKSMWTTEQQEIKGENHGTDTRN